MVCCLHLLVGGGLLLLELVSGSVVESAVALCIPP
jgi:hypothetical protein